MSDTYFSKFPLIEYNGMQAVDITKRCVITKNALNNPYIYFANTVSAGVRSDQLARTYYNDPFLEWNIWLSNEIIDPYNQWFMNPEQFNEFITQKYGSIQLAQQKVKYYTNNWYSDEGMTVSGFDALPFNLSKYYQPDFGAIGNILSYSRIPQDWTLQTNYMVNFSFSVTLVPNTFIKDEIVTIRYSDGSSGNGQIASFSSNNINLQHMIGSFMPANTMVVLYSLYGNESNTLLNLPPYGITQDYTNYQLTLEDGTPIINEYYRFHPHLDTITSFPSLPLDEFVYYDPVTYWEYETNINEANKNIIQMIPSIVPSVSKTLTEELKS